MSVPLSTSITTNEYIDSINSEFSFQLAEMTVFQFPNSDQRKFQIQIAYYMFDPICLRHSRNSSLLPLTKSQNDLRQWPHKIIR